MWLMSTSSNSKAGASFLKAGFGGFEELFVVAFGEVGFVVGSAGLVAEACALDDDAAELEHVPELAGEGEAGVGPLALVGEVDVAVAVEEFDDLGVGFVESGVVADDGGVLGHGLAEFAPELEGVFGAGVVEEELVELLLALELGGVASVAFLRGEGLGVVPWLAGRRRSLRRCRRGGSWRRGGWLRGWSSRPRLRRRRRGCWSAG